MFEDVKKQDSNISAGDPRRAEDMFALVDPAQDAQSALQSGRLRSMEERGAGPADAQMQTVGPPVPLTHLSQLEAAPRRRSRIIMKFLLAITVLLVLTGAGLLAFQFFQAAAPAELVPADDTAPQPEPIRNSNSLPVNTNQEPPDSTAVIDTDGDGLADIQEQALGTDPKHVDSDRDGLTDKDELVVYQTDPLNSDTDNDGLSDRDEIFVWETDPSNPDTDGDTYLDGQEVENGFNPNGPGRLVISE